MCFMVLKLDFASSDRVANVFGCALIRQKLYAEIHISTGCWIQELAKKLFHWTRFFFSFKANQINAIHTTWYISSTQILCQMKTTAANAHIYTHTIWGYETIFFPPKSNKLFWFFFCHWLYQPIPFAKCIWYEWIEMAHRNATLIWKYSFGSNKSFCCLANARISERM